MSGRSASGVVLIALRPAATAGEGARSPLPAVGRCVPQPGRRELGQVTPLGSEDNKEAGSRLWIRVVTDAASNVVGVVFGFAKECRDVMIIERVGHRVATPIALDQVVLPQKAELMRDGRLRDADQQRQIADVEWPTQKRIQDTRARWI